MKKRMAVKIEDINSFTLSGTVVEGTGGELKVRCNACEWTVYVKNPAKRDFTGCRGVFWGKLTGGEAHGEALPRVPSDGGENPC